MRLISLSIPFTALFLLAVAAQVNAEDLSFRNTKSGMLYIEQCNKTEGKQRDAPQYFCYDKDNNPHNIVPGAEWQEINAEKVCFQHQDGRIWTCYELSKMNGGGKKSYACVDKKKNQFPFTPGKDWKRLAGSDTICAEELNRFDVPKNMTMPSLNL